MLKEGKTYDFLYYKTTVFPDGEEYYILESPYKSKHLLSKKTYAHYNFRLNQKIKCKVDKINCTSRVFIEPEHPIYKINEIYEMNFVRNDCLVDSKGRKKDTILLIDKNNIEYICIVDSILDEKEKLSKIVFRLMRIKKGVFYIEKL